MRMRFFVTQIWVQPESSVIEAILSRSLEEQQIGTRSWDEESSLSGG